MRENDDTRTWVFITAEAHAALKSRAIYPWSEEGKRQPDGTWKIPLSWHTLHRVRQRRKLRARPLRAQSRTEDEGDGKAAGLKSAQEERPQALERSRHQQRAWRPGEHALLLTQAKVRDQSHEHEQQ
jgi:hypothetical protein